jgi:hypothetical protein
MHPRTSVTHLQRPVTRLRRLALCRARGVPCLAIARSFAVALSAFDDKARPPKPAQVAKVLGPTHDLWQAIIDHLVEQYPPVDQKWGFSGKQWGWGLRVKQKKRAILYLTPADGFFYVGFALGEKAVAAALEAKPPKRVRDVIDNAPRYAEGRGVRIEVRKKADLKWIQKIAACKMAR